MTAANLKAVATGQATPEQGRNPYESLKRQLEASKAEFLPLFGRSQHNVDRFVRVILNAVLANPDLLQVERRSLFAACMKAAQDGLMPDGREAVLNIYNTKVSKRGEPDRWAKVAQYLPMVGGLVKKLYESGEITYLDAACVFENDRFVFRRGDDPKIEHEPTLDGDPGQIVAAYVVAKLKNGEIKREVMPRREIDAVRAASKTGGSGPWVTWFDQMAIKSVIKRAYKTLPKSDAFERLADADNEAIGFAATPQSVGEIAAQHDSQPQHGQLGHTAADPLEFPAEGGEDDFEPVEQVQQQRAEPTRRAAPAPQQRKPPAFDLDAFIGRIEACTDLAMLQLLSDDSEELPDGPAKAAVNAALLKRDAELAPPADDHQQEQQQAQPEPASRRRGASRVSAE